MVLLEVKAVEDFKMTGVFSNVKHHKEVIKRLGLKMSC